MNLKLSNQKNCNHFYFRFNQFLFNSLTNLLMNFVQIESYLQLNSPLPSSLNM